MREEQLSAKLNEGVEAATKAGEAALRAASARHEEERLQLQMQVQKLKDLLLIFMIYEEYIKKFINHEDRLTEKQTEKRKSNRYPTYHQRTVDFR